MTLQEWMVKLREAAKGNYVSVTMDIEWSRCSDAPQVEWSVWRGDTMKAYRAGTFEDAIKQAIEEGKA